MHDALGLGQCVERCPQALRDIPAAERLLGVRRGIPRPRLGCRGQRLFPRVLAETVPPAELVSPDVRGDGERPRAQGQLPAVAGAGAVNAQKRRLQ